MGWIIMAISKDININQKSLNSELNDSLLNILNNTLTYPYDDNAWHLIKKIWDDYSRLLINKDYDNYDYATGTD